MSEPEVTPWRIAVAVLVTSTVLVAVAVLVSAHIAIVAFACFALAGAAARLLSPTRRAFVVRRRSVDIAVLVAFGAALAYLALTTPLG